MAKFRRYGDPSWSGESTMVPARQASRRSARRHAVQSRRTTDLPVVEIAGVELHAITERQTVQHIIAELADGRGGTVVTPNLDHLYRCGKDLQFHALVSEADLAVPDGMPLIWASRLQGTPLPERVAGSNLITSLNEAAAARGRSIFLLGGSPGAAEGAACALQEKFPGIRIAGIHVPPMGFERSKKLWGEMEQALAAANPDIVWVALGAPKQELTIARLRPLLPAAWWLGVGNSFSFLAGQVERAPLWMQRTGLEWAHRLVQEPGKLWKRYIVAGIPFAARLLAGAAAAGVPNRIAAWRYGRPELQAVGAAAYDDGPAASNGDVAVAGDVAIAPAAGGPMAATPALHSPPAEPNAPSSALPMFRPTRKRYTVSTDVPWAEATRVATVAPPSRIGRVVTHSTEHILKRLRGLILLGGSVRPSPLSAAAGRSVLDLPLDASGSILNFWLAQGVEVAAMAGLEKLPVRVLVNHASREPTSASDHYFGTFRVERDLSEYRGTAGVLRDVAADYADDDFILVANACQILLDPLTAITTALARQGGDVNLVAHDDGTPSGVQLLACKTVRQVGAAGYHDMKEQALPGIAARFDVRVMRRRRPTGLPIRTLEDYLQALRLYHRRRAGKPIVTDPLAEDWAPAFSLIEPGATVAGAARVHDSVVLAGATVEAGSVLVRSLVCGEATVRGDRTVVDQYVTAAPRLPNPVPVAATW
ncbi:MAG: N-acetylmannosaminyltransferase [uncultured Phycisphaerae bacterium]|uniref:N-acetylmannosaminyltransferase n=1 Tax=uncultured Phycisphaerae bacterium TaxID=904963 RepID=A0A6J4PZ96_9BACT|nr:MAG: N-acetylmannosaminyltransferase [uncultured Phycisphaerae bacterium]